MRAVLPDSAQYTEPGRRLLVSLGFVEEDPLRVEAERWLMEHRGAQTKATLAVRAALGHPFPLGAVEAARRFRGVK